jgi:hypothetical protein
VQNRSIKAGEPERRKQVRRKSNVRAWVDPGGTRPAIDCLVVEISKVGARLMEPLRHELPAFFTLKLRGSGQSIPARTKWRCGSIVGVHFQE